MGALLFYSLFVMSTNPKLAGTIPLVLFGMFQLRKVRRRDARGRRDADRRAADRLAVDRLHSDLGRHMRVRFDALKHVPVLIAGGGPVGMTLVCRTLARRSASAACWSSATPRPRGIPRWTSPTAARWSCSGGSAWPTSCVRSGCRKRTISTSPGSRRSRAASRASLSPDPSGRAEACRDPRPQRRHTAARARHARQPGDDRAGAAAGHPRRSAGRGALGVAFEAFTPGRDRRDGHPAHRRDGRDRDCALRFPRRLRRRLLDRARPARHRLRRQGSGHAALHDPFPLRRTWRHPAGLSASPGITRPTRAP